MRITIVTDTYTPDINGAALSLERLTRALLQLGHHIHVIHTNPTNQPHETTFPSFWLPFCKAFNLGMPAYFKLNKLWKNERPDIVYVAIESLLGTSAMLAARRLDIPVVAGFHTNFHQYLKRSLLPQIERPALALLKKIHNYCDASIVPSNYTYETLHNQGFHNLYTIGRGINITRFTPHKRSLSLRKSWGVSNNDCVIIIVGRIAKEKNLDLALQTIKDIRQQQQTSQKIQTVIVGEGSLKKQLAERYPEPEYLWAGIRTGDELATYYASSDIMLFTSETETFGNVIPESLASSLITVAYDYAAAGNLISDGENGYTAPLGDHATLRDKLILAITTKEQTNMRSLARKSTIQLTWADIAQKFIDTMSKISLEQKKTPPTF